MFKCGSGKAAAGPPLIKSFFTDIFSIVKNVKPSFIFVPVARKKKKGIRLYLRIFIWLFAVITVIVIGINLFIVRPHIFYPGFEINIPTGYEIHGIDVSWYQQTINWDQVSAMESGGIKIGFTFIKATEGISRVDKQFKRNWSEAGKQNIVRGAYHFYVPGRDPQKQAQNFMNVVRLAGGDLPPVLDIEKSGRLRSDRLKSDVKLWLETVDKNYGVPPIIYTNISFYEKYFSTGFDKYPIWIAHYLQPDKPRTNRKWSFWQHSETGQVSGINGKVDFNVFYGDSTDFRELLMK